MLDIYGRTVCDHGSEMEKQLSPARDSWKKELQQDLESVQTVGDFAYQRIHHQFVDPGLEIDGTLVSLPLSPLLADQIKAAAKPASLGRNEADAVEDSSGLIWELRNDHFRLVNPSWPAFLESINQDMAHGLGLALSDVDVELDKLVLYEKGSFVRSHRMSQLSPEVTGRLVLCLPSGHNGGEIRLEHAERRRVFATAPASTFDLSALAWHSDVMSEVMETSSGYRLELIYNILPRLGTNTSADFWVKQHTRLRERLVSWPEALSKIVYLLDRRYLQADLLPSKLEAHDRVVFEALSAGCSEAGIYLFLGNVTNKAQDPNDPNDINRGNDPEAGLHLDYLCSSRGQQIVSDMRLSPQHLIPADPYSKRSPDEVEEGDEETEEVYEEEHFPDRLVYHDSVSSLQRCPESRALSIECGVVTDEKPLQAIVLIPRNRLHVLIGFVENIELIMALVIDDQKNHPNDATVRTDILELMNRILDSGKYKLAGLAVVEGAWNLEDKLLYHRAIQHCTADGRIPTGLAKLLAPLVAGLPTPQVVNWSEWFVQIPSPPFSRHTHSCTIY